MKITLISYSLTGNNEALANSIAQELEAKHIRISEVKPRTMSKTMFDVFFNRTPDVDPKPENLSNDEFVVFVGPVWMGRIATPLRSYIREMKDSTNDYAFVTISGGADGPNLNVAAELYKRTGRKPAALVQMYIADLLPPFPKPERKDTSAYKLNAKDVKKLTGIAMKELHKVIEREEVPV